MNVTTAKPAVAHSAMDRFELYGEPASRGKATGPARILRGAGDISRLRPGEIAIVATASSAWVPLLSVAAGIVTETGGSLSSFATAAREHGIPAVVAVAHAMVWLRDGQRVSLDGTTATVAAHD